jgi:hypothetical protein
VSPFARRKRGAQRLNAAHSSYRRATINASQLDTTISISKKAMVWPVIVSICEVNTEDALLSDYDDGTVDDIINRYKGIIDNNSERFEFVTKVMSAYNAFNIGEKTSDKTRKFISKKWQEFSGEFSIPNNEQDILEPIVKLAISNVIRRNRTIVRIKSEVGL